MRKRFILQENTNILNIYESKTEKLPETKADSTTRRERWIHFHTWSPRHPSITDGQVSQAENQQGNSWTQQCHQSTGCDRQLQTASSNNVTFSSSHGVGIGIYRLLHPTTSRSQAHMEQASERPHWAVKHVFKNVKGHIRTELKIDNRKITGKPPNINTRILNSTLLTDTWLEEKSQK